jgi:hypothetical protein
LPMLATSWPVTNDVRYACVFAIAMPVKPVRRSPRPEKLTEAVGWERWGCSLKACLGRRCERLALLYHIRDQNPGLGLARFTSGMRGFGWYLETIAGFEHVRRLTLNRELEAALQKRRPIRHQDACVARR